MKYKKHVKQVTIYQCGQSCPEFEEFHSNRQDGQILCFCWGTQRLLGFWTAQRCIKNPHPPYDWIRCFEFPDWCPLEDAE